MMSRSTGRAMDSEMEHIAQSIADILTTPIGSRVMRRDYGSLVPRILDRPDNAAATIRLTAAIASALMRWEPRIRLQKIDIARQAEPTMPGRAWLTLHCAYLTGDAAAGKRIELEVSL